MPDLDLCLMTAEHRVAIDLNGEIRSRLDGDVAKWNAACLVGGEMPSCEQVEEMTEGVGDIITAEEPQIHFAVVEKSIR